jgi:hypothetical protein
MSIILRYNEIYKKPIRIFKIPIGLEKDISVGLVVFLDDFVIEFFDITCRFLAGFPSTIIVRNNFLGFDILDPKF